MIVLNGGANQDIIDTYQFLNNSTFNFYAPYGYFKEDEYSLGGIMTCCGIVLPENIYNAVDSRKAMTLVNDLNFQDDHGINDYFYICDGGLFATYKENSNEWKLIKLLKSCSLAR
jgi:hypothetical protein